MVVSIDKATALKMHDKVRSTWRQRRQEWRKIGTLLHLRRPEVRLWLGWKCLKTTDMALIVSPAERNCQMQKHGLDIVPHRKRHERIRARILDEKFKDRRIVGVGFLCAMWLTGLTAPSCSTVYLDKPMRNHTLMADYCVEPNRGSPASTAA